MLKIQLGITEINDQPQTFKYMNVILHFFKCTRLNAHFHSLQCIYHGTEWLQYLMNDEYKYIYIKHVQKPWSWFVNI